MPYDRLTRRGFLRLSLYSTASALAAACQGALPDITATPGEEKTAIPSPKVPPPTPTPLVESGIRLSGVDAEAWAWNQQIRGDLENPETCANVLVQNNTAQIEAMIEKPGFSATVPIEEGANRLVAVCRHADGREEISTMLIYTGRLQQRPTAIIKVSLSGGRFRLEGGESLPDELDSQAITEYIWSPRSGNPGIASLTGMAGTGEVEFEGEVRAQSIEITLPPIDGEYYFKLRVVDQAGREDAGAIYLVMEDGQPRIPDFDRGNPAWVESAIVYGVIPRLFGRPGAQAVLDRLDDLADLGIDALWLSPVNESPDFGYSVTDYFELRESFGTKEDFHRLIQAAHVRGIRVLMDFVPNHTSDKHPYFQDTVEHGQESHYWDFYDRDEQGNYTYYFDWPHLPNLNYDNPEVRRWMLEAFSYWVREFDVDGFRVDVAWGIRERRPDFWPEWRRELKRIKPDLLLLAEAGARDPYYFDNGFDAAYDWTGQLGKWAWGQFWGEEASEVDETQLINRLKQALSNPPEGFHPDALVFRFLNNNDTGTRFITIHGLEMTRVATALLLTLPGLPCIYTADEVGEWFRPYFDPAPLAWEERYPGLRDYHKQLIALRKEISSLHSRLWQVVEVEPGQQALGYLRFLEGGAEPVLVLLNFSQENAQVEAWLPDGFQAQPTGGRLLDLLSGQQVPVRGQEPLTVLLPAYQALILKLT